MGDRVVAGPGRPTHWFVIFTPETSLWWVRLLARGRFKHVRACGHVPGTDIWIFFDHRLSGLAVHAASGAAADRLMAQWCHAGEVIHVAQGEGARPFFPMMSCVTAVRHLVGARSGALRPDRLWRDLLANGGTVCHGLENSATSLDGGSSADEPDAQAGERGPGRCAG